MSSCCYLSFTEEVTIIATASSWNGRRLGPPIRIAKGDTAHIMKAIYEGGAVVAGMKATDGFMKKYKGSALLRNYREGVYARGANEYDMGGHAVSLHGWGATGSNVLYWTGKN